MSNESSAPGDPIPEGRLQEIQRKRVRRRKKEFLLADWDSSSHCREKREAAQAKGEAAMNIDTATPLQRGIYNMCLELEQLPASALQTRLVTLLSDANREIESLLAALASERAARETLENKNVASDRAGDYGRRDLGPALDLAGQRAVIERAREATGHLRDAARLGQVIGFRERDPLVVAIHAAIDLAERAARAQEPQQCPHGNRVGACSWCDLRDDGGLPEARTVSEADEVYRINRGLSDTRQPDYGLQAVALREWARLIRLAEDQDTLLQIADDIDVNAAAMESKKAAPSRPAGAAQEEK